MMKITHKDDYDANQKRCEGASSNVARALIRTMTSHFVAQLCGLATVPRQSSALCKYLAWKKLFLVTQTCLKFSAKQEQSSF